MPIQHLLLKILLVVLVLLTAASGSTSSPLTQYVTFPARDGRLQLEGTLKLPCLVDNANEPVLGVVLIHGSGPHSRYVSLSSDLVINFGFGIPVFHEIGDALQNQGFAVLTYDKRSCSSWNACNNNNYPFFPNQEYLLYDFLEDAEAAVSYLQGRDEVKSDALAVVGHSQGGTFVPIMLESRPDLLCSGIILSTPFDPIDELLAYQVEYLLNFFSRQGYTVSEAKQLPGMPEAVEMLEFRQGVRSGTISDDQATTSFGITAAFVKSEFDLEEQALSAAASLNQTLLVLGGEIDQKVPVEQALLWRDYLEEIGANFELETFPCVSHALNCINETITQATISNVGKHVDPRLVERLVEFVQATTKGKAVMRGSSSGGARHCHD